MDTLRKCRRKHLRPITNMPIGEIIIHIEGLKLNQLRALLRAMDSCTDTNCGWTECAVKEYFRCLVTKMINIREGKKRR